MQTRFVNNHVSAQKLQLKVRMCCPKCEEKVLEEIWEVRGVFDVMASRVDKKVVVTAMPSLPDGFHYEGRAFEGREGFLDTDEVLRKARKIDCKARFVKLDELPKPIKLLPNPNLPRPQVDQTRPKPHPDANLQNVMYPPSGASGGFHNGPPPMFFRDPAQDDNTPFYFLLFVILLLSLLLFRK